MEVAQSVHGKKVLIYLINPRDPHFCHPDVINILKNGDNNVTRYLTVHFCDFYVTISLNTDYILFFFIIDFYITVEMSCSEIRVYFMHKQ